MLENAVLDAKALKEVAFKNAENLVVEKFSEKIKEAVSKILEQDEEEFSGEELSQDMSMDMGMDSLEQPTMDVSLAATDSEKMCSCPEDDEEIEIDFDDLQQQIQQDDEVSSDELVDREALADDIVGGDEEMMEESSIDEILDLLVSDDFPETTAKKIEADEDEEDSEEELSDLDKRKFYESKIQDLEKKLKSVEKEKITLSSLNEKYIELLKESKIKLEQMNLKNVQLYYLNKVFRNVSLNERQKERIAEFISNTKETDSIKVIYESLQGAMGERKIKSLPESLSEVVSKTTSKMLTVNRKQDKQEICSNPMKERFQMLAGIKKK